MCILNNDKKASRNQFVFHLISQRLDVWLPSSFRMTDAEGSIKLSSHHTATPLAPAEQGVKGELCWAACETGPSWGREGVYQASTGREGTSITTNSELCLSASPGVLGPPAS